LHPTCWPRSLGVLPPGEDAERKPAFDDRHPDELGSPPMAICSAATMNARPGQGDKSFHVILMSVPPTRSSNINANRLKTLPAALRSALLFRYSG
ncbi:MAG: hypothetical protein ACREJF_08575, partial [Candidatus Methylomirabilales bacterium]